jgi:hypothetical protein
MRASGAEKSNHFGVVSTSFNGISPDLDFIEQHVFE